VVKPLFSSGNGCTVLSTSVYSDHVVVFPPRARSILLSKSKVEFCWNFRVSSKKLIGDYYRHIPIYGKSSCSHIGNFPRFLSHNPSKRNTVWVFRSTKDCINLPSSNCFRSPTC